MMMMQMENEMIQMNFSNEACASLDTDGDKFPDEFHKANNLTSCTYDVLNKYRATFKEVDGEIYEGRN